MHTEKPTLFDFCHPRWFFSPKLNETRWVQVEAAEVTVIGERGPGDESNRIRFSQRNDGQQNPNLNNFQVHTCTKAPIISTLVSLVGVLNTMNGRMFGHQPRKKISRYYAHSES